MGTYPSRRIVFRNRSTSWPVLKAEKLTRTALDALKQLNVAEDDPLYEMTVELCSRKK